MIDAVRKSSAGRGSGLEKAFAAIKFRASGKVSLSRVAEGRPVGLGKCGGNGQAKALRQERVSCVAQTESQCDGVECGGGGSGLGRSGLAGLRLSPQELPWAHRLPGD